MILNCKFQISNSQKGFTLIEVVISIGILLVLAASAAGLYADFIKGLTYYRQRTTVASLADQYMEIVRNMSYVDIGTLHGTPPGSLPDYAEPKTVNYDGVDYEIYYVVNAVHDPASPNVVSQDYKQVKLYIREVATGVTENFLTTVAMNSLAGLQNLGSLSVKVFDALGQPLSGASVRIMNSYTTPTIDICRLTDATGGWLEAGLPCLASGNQCLVEGLDYSVFVNDPACPNYKDDYSRDQSYPNPYSGSIPLNPDPAVYFGQITYSNFQIDETSDITIEAYDQSCNPVSSLQMELFGAKKIGISPDLLKFDQNLTTNSSGEAYVINAEWDSYSASLLGSSYTIYGSSEAQPFFLNPGEDKTLSLVVGPYSANTLLVVVQDAALDNLIDGAAVELTNLDTGVTVPAKISGLTSTFTQSNWAGGDGLKNFTQGTSRYYADNGYIDTSSGSVKIAIEDGNDYYTGTQWLMSSTFNTGSSQYFMMDWTATTEPPETVVGFQIATSASPHDEEEDTFWDEACDETVCAEFLGPDGTVDTFYSVLLQDIIETDGYFKYKVYLSNQNNKNKTPELNSVKIIYASPCQAPGQAMFTGLDSAASYLLSVSATGYDPQTISPLSISGYNVLPVLLVPGGGAVPSDTYTIKASITTSGGSITPSGTIVVAEGGEQVFEISADSGFSIRDILVDGISEIASPTVCGSIASSEATCTFTNVMGNHTIAVSFVMDNPPRTVPPYNCLISNATDPDGEDGPLNGGGSRNWNDPLTWDYCGGSYPKQQAYEGYTYYDNVAATSSSGNLIVNITAYINSFDLTNFSATLSSSGSIVVNPIDAGTVKAFFSADMTQNWTGNLYLRPAVAAATINLTTNGKILRYIIRDSGAGTVEQEDDLNLYYSGINLQQGIWNTNNHNINMDRCAYFYAYINSVFNVGTSTVNMTVSSTTIYTTPQNKFYDLNITSYPTTNGPVVSFYVNNSYGNTTEVTHSLSLSGANSTNRRLYLVSNSVGTQYRLIVPDSSTANYSNLDFRDINLDSSEGQIDLADITGASGDCGGNSNIVFSDSVDQHWLNVNGGNWSDPANWTSRVPLCQDDVYMDTVFGSDKTVTVDTRMAGASVDWSGATWSGGYLRWNFYGFYPEIHGSLTLKAGMTMYSGNYFNMLGRGQNTLTTNGVELAGGLMFYGPVAMQDDITIPDGRYMYVRTGAVVTNPNDSTMRLGAFSQNYGNFTMCNSSCMWYVKNNTTGAIALWYSYGGTLDSTGATIDITNNASPAGTVNDTISMYNTYNAEIIIHGDSGTKGIALTANNTTFNGNFTVDGTSGTKSLSISGGTANHFNGNFRHEGGDASKTLQFTGPNVFSGDFYVEAPKNLVFQANVTQTMQNFLVSGTAGNTIILKSHLTGQSLPGGTEAAYFTLNVPAGTAVNCDYLNISDSHAGPVSATWHAGAHSINATGNAGWLFP